MRSGGEQLLIFRFLIDCGGREKFLKYIFSRNIEIKYAVKRPIEKAGRNEACPTKGIDTILFEVESFFYHLVEMRLARLRALTHSSEHFKRVVWGM